MADEKQDKLKVVFMGSDVLSGTFLSRLAHEKKRINIAAVITQPDKARGRSLSVAPGPIKDLAFLHVIPALSPINVNAPEFVAQLKQINPDLIIVMAYGQFLGAEILALPRLGCVNMHVSALPKYRGAAPIQYAIMNGDCETGVSAIMMARKMDAGDILGIIRREIRAHDTAGSLGLDLAKKGSELMIEVMDKLNAGACPRAPQDESQTTFAPKINEQAMPAIDWSRSAQQIERLVRAMNPKPYCHTYLPGKDPAKPFMPGLRLKIIAAEITPRPAASPPDAAPGTVLAMKGGPIIATGSRAALRLASVCVEGKPIINGAGFSNGYANKLAVGDILRSGE